MNAVTFPQRTLYWKEFRQITPLILMLLGVALALMVLWSGFEFSSRALETAGQYIPLILPALYAAGAGAILVGQEKETRTLEWFSSLPVPPRRIITTKLLVALAGLLVMWLGCWLLMSLVRSAGRSSVGLTTPMEDGVTSLLLWLSHSLFILCCGFYTAWRLKNTFASLLAILPIACVPFLINLLYAVSLHGWTGRRYVAQTELPWAPIGITCVAIAVVGWLAYRAALQVLRPAEPDPVSDPLDEPHATTWHEGWRPAATIGVSSQPFRYPLTSLVWQSIHHNRIVLGALAGLIFTGAICLALTAILDITGSEFVAPALVIGMIAGFVGVSWLGVFAFTGDGGSPRLRFLADRGISPTIAWVGRQANGLSIISLAILLYAVISFWSMSEEQALAVIHGWVPTLVIHGRTPTLSVATLACVAWVTYAVSQWTSQVIRILAASAFVAPLISGIVVYLLGFAAIELHAPFWLLLLCSALPMLATWLMMRRYMDNHERLSIWGTAVAVASLMVLLPLVPTVIEIVTWPKMDGSTRAKLMAEARQLPETQNVQSMMRQDTPWLGVVSETLSGAEALELSHRHSLSPDEFFQAGSNATNETVALQADLSILESAVGLASLVHLQYEAAPDDSQATAALDEWMHTMTRIVKQLRNSHRWLDQEAADFVEIWLVQTLAGESMQAYREREAVTDTLMMLADQPARNRARRRAVLVSWSELQRNPTDRKHKDIGGLGRSSWLSWLSSTEHGYVLERTTDAVTVTALRLIEAGENGQSTESLRRELHQLIVGPTMRFESGPYSDRIRVGATASDANSIQPTSKYPANQWYAAWEADAKRLVPGR